jgi:hypothetical protein
MSRNQSVKLSLKTLLILCIWIFGFVFHNSIYTFEHKETLPVASARAELDSSDAHEHEDDLTSPGKITPHVLIGIMPRLQGAHLSAFHNTPIPIIPPPKSI